MKRILLNATQTEETRVAIVDGQYLYDLDIESVAQNKRKSNIYKGTVTRVEASLEAAFIDYGADRHGFLPLKEVARSLFSESGGKRTIQQALKEGQELIVQVEKEERGNKGAALTTQVSLAGRYLVLMPRTEGSGGISRKVESSDRDELRETMNGVQIPPDMSAIARTMALGRSQEELQWDLNYLEELWNSITRAAETRPAPFLIYQESNIVSRTIRDHLRSDVSDVIIDDPAVYAEAVEFMQQLMPQNLEKLTLYEDSIPLFTRYQIENQIETAHQRSVTLRSGGSIVIDHNEALTSIDINSARATQGSDIEETAFRTNMEAAEEIARQLRLRDLGGLLVIDFIDMNSSRNQREVENCLRDATKADRARIQIGKISRFGLLEMSRQRLGASLREISAINCPRCDGQGTIRTVESLGLHLLRLIEDEAHKERTARISVQVPVAVATFLFNEKRDVLADLDKRLGIHALILPNPNLETPHYDIQRTRVQDLNKTLEETASFELPVIDEEERNDLPVSKPPERPLVTPVARVSPPQQEAKKKKGLLARIFGWLSSESKPKSEPGRRKQSAKNRDQEKRSDKGSDNRPRNQANRSRPARSDSRRSSENKQEGSSSRRGGKRGGQGDASKNETPKNNEQRKTQQSDNKNGNNGDEAAEGPRPSSRRGNRGGRGRGNRKPEAENNNADSNKSNNSSEIDAAASNTQPPMNSSHATPVEKTAPSSVTTPGSDATAPVATPAVPPRPVTDRPAPAQEASIPPGQPEQTKEPESSAAGAPKPAKPAQQATTGIASSTTPPATGSPPESPRTPSSARPTSVQPVTEPDPKPQQPQAPVDRVNTVPPAAAPATSPPPATKAPAPSPVTAVTAPPASTNGNSAAGSSPPAASAARSQPVTIAPTEKQSSQPAIATDADKPQPRPNPPAPKAIPGQIETRASEIREPVASPEVVKTPSPRPTDWKKEVEPTVPGKQIETQNGE